MEKIFIWGTGRVADFVLSQCSIYEEYQILGYIDNNIEKQGKIFKNEKIYAPDILYSINFDHIVILSNFYYEIEQQIKKMFPERTFTIENSNYFYKQSILRRYKNESNEEIVRVLKYIENKDLEIFNYDYVDKYKSLDINVIYDRNCEMFFVYHQGKKLYFAKDMDSKEKVQDYYRQLLIEQDPESPHKYTNSDFNVNKEDIVIDAGAAEGIFSLEIIDKVSKIYLIETESRWIEALKETFKDYWEKIVIIERFITSLEEGYCTTLDRIIAEPVNFIKMDIEGNEWDALLGAKELIDKSNHLKCAITSYHSDFDEILIKNVLEKYGLQCFTSTGYMWFPYKAKKDYISLKLCRGLVFGMK